MSTDKVRHNTDTRSDGAEDLKSVLQDMEQIIHETLPPAQADAYIARLKRLLAELGCKVAL